MQPESSQGVWGSVAIGPVDPVFSRPASNSGAHKDKAEGRYGKPYLMEVCDLMLPLQPLSVCSCEALIGTENCCSFAELLREKGNSIALGPCREDFFPPFSPCDTSREINIPTH